MSEKDYSLIASLGIYDSKMIRTVSHYTLEMARFGIRKGVEVTSEEIREGGLPRIVGFYKDMKRPSPMTLLWSPSEGQKAIFDSNRKNKLKIELDFVMTINKNRPRVRNLLLMDKVEISQILPEVVGENGSEITYQRIVAYFSKLHVYL